MESCFHSRNAASLIHGLRWIFVPPVTFVKPHLFISRCIEFAPCRWDGEIINNEVVHALKDYVEFLPICPETEIGMGVPRDPLQIVVTKKKKSLVQIKDKRDFTSLIKVFAAKFLETQKDLDGFILKSKSPSCGAYSTKLYKDVESPEPIGIGSGIFADLVQKFFPLLPIIEESDLNDEGLRDFFFTRIYTLAAFRVVEKEQSIDLLRQFQGKNEKLFEWFNPALNSSMKAFLKQDSDIDKVLLFSNFRNSLLLLLQERPPFAGSVKDLQPYPEDLRTLFRS